MDNSQPKLRLGSMETVFALLAAVVGLYLIASLVPLVLTFIWVVIPALLTIALIGAVVYALWRLVRA